MSKIRIPAKYLEEIVKTYKEKDEWTFETPGGNVLQCTKVEGVDSFDGRHWTSIDFLWNPDD